MTKIKIKNAFDKLINNRFHALTNQNYRYFWIGQCVSLIGTWMQTVGQAWLVYTLTNSALLLGLLGAMQFLPVTIFTLFAGVLIDKYPKKKILMITQTFSMILALMLALLVFTNNVRYEYILILAVLLGISNSIDMPARQSFMIEIAGRDDLMNAIALNSMAFNLAKILGPSLGALLMASFGTGWVFLINGLSYLAVIYGLSLIKIDFQVRKIKSNNIISEIKDGLGYIKESNILSRTILMMLVIGSLAFNYNVLLPVFVKNVLNQDAKAFGILMAAIGIGSIFGAFTVSSKGNSRPKIKIMTISALIISILLIFLGFNTKYVIAIVLLMIVGAFSIYFTTTANTMLQINSTDEYRGRVMSVYALVFAGSTPIGSLYTGLAIKGVGVLNTFKLSGTIIFVFTIIIFLIYRKKGNE